MSADRLAARVDKLADDVRLGPVGLPRTRCGRVPVGGHDWMTIAAIWRR